MALNQSPSIVTNGLVYYHDMGNTQKSWKGAPTTNVIQTDLNLYDKDHGCAVTQLSETFEGNPIYRVVFPSGTLPRIRTTFSYTTGQQFTGSIYYKVVTQGSDTPQLWFRENGFGTVYVSTPLSSTTWQRASISYTFSSSGTSMFLLYQSNSLSTAPTIIDFSMPQTELGSFATPFIAGTRTTSQAIADLTNTNTVTTTADLTYNSNNTFSFANKVGFTSTLTGSSTQQQYTRIAWVTPSSLGTVAGFKIIWCNGIGNNGDMALCFEGNGYPAFHQYTTSPQSEWTLVSSTLAVANQTYMIAVTVNRISLTNNVNLYVNGQLVATGTNTGLATSASDTMYFGGALVDGYSGGRMFSGQIHSAMHYNRALSAAEVLQNFNALKGRYGL